ncbi:MAG: hypothetical protein M3O67_06135 [Bacteroidota bacterium]|nr:hypothetical protein [Bacteroidota bacterium]
MDLKQTSKSAVISGALIIWIIKFFIRPGFHFDEPVRLLLGVAPNLFGAFLIPFGAFWIFSGREFLLARIFRIHSVQDLRMVCMMAFGLLVINEYLQLIPFFGRTFDVLDILFSAVGLIASYVVFGKLHNRHVYRSF